jgi:predicted nucleic acid-binding protein
LKSSVLDSYAVLVFLFRQRGHEKVLEMLERTVGTERPSLIAAPNWAEVRYMVERKAGAEQWPNVRAKLRALPIEVVPADDLLAEQAGALKATRKMSLAHCFAAALAQQRRADLYTGDPEFRAVEKEVRIVWL